MLFAVDTIQLMTHKIHYSLIPALLLSFALFANAQEGESQGVSLHGSFQTDILVPQKDSLINTEYAGPFLSNSYLDLALASKYVTAGARLELMHKPLPGFEDAFAGGGLPYIHVTGHYKWFEMTVGNVYDQFGSGLIFRAYEDRPLGVDNSLRGARIVLTPYKGIRFKALGGMQRAYFNYNAENWYGFNYGKGAVMGVDLELGIEEWIPKMAENGYRLAVGGSYVSKYEPDEDLILPTDPTKRLNLPKFVGAGDVRVRFQKGGWNALVEYAYKANDPTAENGYIYKPGSAALVSLTYSQRGMAFLLQAKRSENMGFRSDRTGTGISGNINHLPAFTMTHTYALAALYPYATQTAVGEWAFQAEARYTFKRKTPMGGKYGTSFRLNGSYVRGLKKTPVEMVNGSYWGTNGYKSPFFGMGDETYYLDVHLEFSKKITKTFSMTALYMYQQYNQKVVEGHGVNGDIVKSHIGIAELKYKPTSNIGMRFEVQYLHTRQDLGQWLYGLYEISLFQQCMIEVSDMFNIDAPAGKPKHFYKVAATYNWGAHRIQLSYGRTREGYNCSGGVCRFVPASKGLALSYNVSF